MGRRFIITEKQYKKLIGEMAYPTTFNMEEFKNINSYKGKFEYCKERLKYISSGSARYVFAIDDQKVLKLAKNIKGIKQNEVEYNLGGGYYSSPLFAEIFDVDENYNWIEMQLANKCSKSLFKQITGLDFDYYCDCVRYIDSYITNSRFKIEKPQNFDEVLNNNEFLFELQDIIGSFEVMVGDLTKMSSYGVVNNNKVVIIDYGYTKDVVDYYN